MRKICIITGTRAEYGLFYWLMKEIQANTDLELQIIATGMHLSPEFGLTYKQIEKDGFQVNKKSRCFFLLIRLLEWVQYENVII